MTLRKIFNYIFIIIFIILMCYTSIYRYKSETAIPHIKNYLGTYKPNQQIGGWPVTFGMDKIRVTPHDIYGYLNNQETFDFHYYSYQYYHPLYLSDNDNYTINGLDNGTESLTLRRNKFSDNGLLLHGYYKYNHLNLTDKVYDNYNDASNPITEYSNYGIVKPKARETHKTYRITNAKQKIKLPRVNTTMIISTNKKEFGINPLGGRTINTTGTDGGDGINFKQYNYNNHSFPPESNDFSYVGK